MINPHHIIGKKLKKLEVSTVHDGIFSKKSDSPLIHARRNTNINYVEETITLGKRVRPPIVDGLFYPEDSTTALAYMKETGLKRGKGGFARAIIAPHGAWEISGRLATAAFASAGGRVGRKSPSRIVIMGPVHENGEEGIFLTNSHLYQTPLGDILVDQEASEWLESYSPLIKVNDIPHLYEHSIEVLLPFVKYCFPQTPVVPILMGGQRKQHIRVLANALRAIFKPEMENTLLVISFNLGVHAKEAAALNMAQECRRLFSEGSHDDLCAAFQDGRITGCGGALVAALLQSGLVDTAHPALASDLLLNAKGEKDKTVYYGAFSFE
jgi:AmmeMemoRadiSam system protein B